MSREIARQVEILTVRLPGWNCSVGGRPLVLTRSQFRCLSLIVQRAPAVVPYDELLAYAGITSRSGLDQVVAKVRGYLGGEFYDWIETVRGQGLRWVGRFEIVDGSSEECSRT